MRKYTCLIILILSTVKSEAQLNNGIDTKNSLVIDLKFERTEERLDSSFSSISVIDARDDSSKVGFYSIGKTGKDWPKYYEIMPSMKDGICKWLTNYLAIESGAVSSKCSLVVVIKKLWLSSDAVPENNEDGKTLQSKQLGFAPGCITKIEFYLGKDSSLYPMYRIDSIFHYKEDLPENASYYVAESLKASLRQLFKINLDKVLTRSKRITMEQVLSNNRKLINSEIVETVQYKKGVYKNFQEFKKNNPSISEYEVRVGAMGDVLYVKEANTEYPLRTAWGYCDGSFLYVNSGDKYFKLFKSQNTFYFAGFKGVERTARHDIPYTSLLNLATNTGRKYTQFSKIIKYYKLDMETGEAY